MHDSRRFVTSNHWGLSLVQVEGERILDAAPHPADPDPSPLNGNIADALGGRARVLRPAIRKSWLERVEGERGRDSFVEVSWDFALDRIAEELRCVREAHGNGAIFAGSYGWASAGRFHHAQSQLKRFLNTQGGFVRSEGNYSYNAALVAMPHVVGGSFREHLGEATRWSVIADHSELVVLFGGMPMRNTQISDGGASKHRMADNLAACARNGVRFINLSPLRADVSDGLDAEWLPPRPGSDTAVMMGLAHTLLTEGLHDPSFLNRYTVGFDRVAAYLLGEVDATPKDADWAGNISGLPAERIRRLAQEMASNRTMISCAASLQRADWGENPIWMCVTLAAMLGQIGLPGGGYTVGYGVNGHVGNIERPFRAGAFSQGANPISEFIPVAMISDMLLNPGAGYRYNGAQRVLPSIRLVWWAGGNPFHHHQDLNRLHAAFQRPETVIVNEIAWTSTARHADIVLPVAATPERTDFGAGRSDNVLVPMPAMIPPPGAARTEFSIYADLASRMGDRAAFTEGLDEDEWLRRLWLETQEAGERYGVSLPDWDAFIAGDIIELPDPSPNQVFLSEFRADPVSNARPTPSGRIELYSETVAGFGLRDFPGHAVWNAPRDMAAGADGRYPLSLVSGQPGTRLHSQLDNGAYSRAAKVEGREPVLINSKDAADRAIRDGDIVELFNDRGRCLAGARVTDDICPGAVFLWTGAWYDPDFADPDRRDRHGNPNVLTHDDKTSEFSQSPAAHSAMIEVRRLAEPPPAVRAFEPPIMVESPRSLETT